MNDLYACDDYKSYLRLRFNEMPRVRFAEAVGCLPSFLSQVLNGKPNLSLEQGVQANRILGHDYDQSEYFMDLLQLGRAGSLELRHFFQQRLINRKRAVRQVSKQIQNEEMQDDFAPVYYSRFIFPAVHVLSSLPLRDQEAELVRRLNLELADVTRTLTQLQSAGLVRKQAGSWRPTKKRLHLKAGSPDIVHHHRNFRLESLRRLERRVDQDIFYSGIFTVSRADVERIRELLLQLIRDKEAILGPSRDEVPFVMNMDFFVL